MRKRAQIKMIETISVLIIFFVLLVFGFMFYSQFQKRSLLIEQHMLIEKRAVVNSLKTTYLAEFRCEHTEPSGTCIDLERFRIFAELLNGPEMDAYYSNVFSTSHIYYVDVLSGRTGNLYDGSVEGYSKTTVQTPVLLRDVLSQRDSFGVLYVDYYYK